MLVRVPRWFFGRLVDWNIAMSTEVLIGDGEAARLTAHPLRAAILGELHARPFTPLQVPSRILHFGFDTSGARAQADRASRGSRETSPRPLRYHRPALGTAFGIHHLH